MPLATDGPGPWDVALSDRLVQAGLRKSVPLQAKDWLVLLRFWDAMEAQQQQAGRWLLPHW